MKIRCAKCEKKFKVPDTYQGRKVRCFNCDTVFVAAALIEAEEADVSLWRGAMSQAAERYGGYEEEPAAPPPPQAGEAEATLEEETPVVLMPQNAAR